MPIAKPGDPLVLPNGHAVTPRDRSVPEVGTVLSRIPNVKDHKSTEPRTIKDMPATDPVRQHAINVVLIYHMFGLTANEIAHAVGLAVSDVRALLDDEAMQQTYEQLFLEFININSSHMLSRITAYSGQALQRVVTLSEKADKDIVSLRASQDILDRAGLSSKVLHEAPAETGDTLRIVVESGEGKQTPNINININKKSK